MSDQRTDGAAQDERKRCRSCFMFELAGAGYYCYIGMLAEKLETEPSEKKRKRLSGQIRWALGHLKELDEFKKSIGRTESCLNSG